LDELATDSVKVIDMYKEHPDNEVAFMLESHLDDKKTRVLFFDDKKDKASWYKVLGDAVKAAKVTWVKQETAGFNEELLKSKLRKDTLTGDQVRAVAYAASDPTNGVPLKTRKHVMRTFKNCFFGKELVSWLVNQGYCDSRDDGVAVGRELLGQNFIMHVTNEHNLKDENLLYKFAPTLVPEDGGKGRTISGKRSLTLINSSPRNSPPPASPVLVKPQQPGLGNTHVSPSIASNSGSAPSSAATSEAEDNAEDVDSESEHFVNESSASTADWTTSASEVSTLSVKPKADTATQTEETSMVANDGNEEGDT